jgi:menaquinone-dependent protoporphyrinogen IX oxidase
MGAALVVYCTRTGYTRRVAELLASALEGRTCELTERRSRRGVVGYSRCLWEASMGRDAPIDNLACEPADAELVIIGTPIWGWHLASPARTFARRFRADIRHCAFFCTMGGAGSDAAFAELQRLTGQAPLATLALTDAEIDDGRAVQRIQAFAAQLKDALRQAGTSRDAAPVALPAQVI